MTDQITLRGLEVFAFHGVLADEQSDGQKFLLDLELELDTAPAAAEDDVTQTVDYGGLADEVVRIVSTERYDLLETLAHRVAMHCMADERVHKCAVTVHKPNAPIRHPFGDVSVTVRYPR